MISEEQYKREKEAWVTGCTGGSISEILVVCSPVIASHWLWCTLVKRYAWANNFAVQFIVYVLPVLSAQTVAADYAALVTAGLVLLATFAQFARQTDQPSKPEPPSNYKPYLTVYRGGIMLLTCIAILAVDFPIFPRRFAKVETFGTSLMDVGVGSVVFSSGIVAARPYVNQNAPAGIYALLGSIRSALPILVLGFLRLALTKGVDYQEHHSEYGLHWNFFFTLGFLPPFVTLASFLYKLFPFSVLGGIIAAGYQFVLSQGLQAWIASAPRLDLISANKEGISSFSGYLAIFLLGLDSGTIVFSRSLGSSRLSRWLGLTKTTPVKQIAIQLTLRAAMLWLAFQIWIGITGHQEDLYVSRQMANLPYVLWVTAFNLTLLGSLTWVESAQNITGHTSPLLDAVNVNSLATFLWANILTGLTNLSIRTLYCNTTESIIVCVVYMVAVSALPWLLWQRFRYKIPLK